MDKDGNALNLKLVKEMTEMESALAIMASVIYSTVMDMRETEPTLVQYRQQGRASSRS